MSKKKIVERIARFCGRVVLACNLAWACTAKAALNDVFPGDFVALPAGTTVATAYAYDRRQDGVWQQGRKFGDLRLDTRALALRVSHYLSLGGWKVAPLFVASIADVSLGGASAPPAVAHSRSGLGDLRLGATVWLLDDPQRREYLGLNLMAVWPTGRHDGDEIANPGENRRRQALMLGWVKGLGEHWTLDLTGERAWYGANRDAYPGGIRSEQARTDSLTGYLRYKFTARWQGLVGFQFNEGGETRVNGVGQGNPIHGRRVFVGATAILGPHNLLNIRLGADEAVRSGFRTKHELALRWIRIFR